MAGKLNWYGLVTTVAVGLYGLAVLFGAFDLSLGARLGALVFVGCAVFALLAHRRSNAKAARAAEITDGGTRGVATVVSIDTKYGATMEMELRLRLRLEMPGAAPRQIDLEEEVTDYAADGIKQGMRLPVIVDSADPDRVVLVW